MKKKTESTKRTGSKLPALVVYDFDGVLTDNKVIVSEDGKEFVVCSRGDGMGMEMARKSGLKQLILSKEKNPVVSARGKKLQVDVIQGIEDKPTALRSYCKKHGIALTQVLYVGNDLNDLSVMKIVGSSACPRDAHRLVKKVANIILKYDGGNGAVRELIEEHLKINTYL